MKIFKPVVISIAMISLALGLASCKMPNTGSSDKMDKAKIESIVHDYLLAHPEILIKMSQKLQQQQAQKQTAKALTTIQSSSDDIFNPKDNPIVGNKDGKVTLVEFFDYQCVHCVHSYPEVKKLIKDNPDLRVVFFDFPIFGDASQYAAFAALYANTEGKYLEMHDAIFSSGLDEGKLTTAAIDKMAKAQGLDLDKMHAYIKTQKANLKNQKTEGGVYASYMLAQKLGIQGTPAFIVAPTPKTGNSQGKTKFMPGAVDAKTLQAAIDAAK